MKLENPMWKEDDTMLSVVSRYATLAIVIALSLAVAAGPAMAQTQQSAPPLPGGATPPPTEKAPTMGMLEGAVKKVDPAAGTVQVSSGPFGIIGRTLEVTNDTQIQVEGRQGSLSDLREGAKVKAAYESRGGKNVATQIEVMPAQEKSGGKTGTQMPEKSQ
jgi:Cu/Ag efflux protein CusF